MSIDFMQNFHTGKKQTIHDQTALTQPENMHPSKQKHKKKLFQQHFCFIPFHQNEIHIHKVITYENLH